MELTLTINRVITTVTPLDILIAIWLTFSTNRAVSITLILTSITITKISEAYLHYQ